MTLMRSRLKALCSLSFLLLVASGCGEDVEYRARGETPGTSGFSGTSGATGGTSGGDTTSGAPLPGETSRVVLPLGETLFFDGDDYLYFHGVHTARAVLEESPAGATAVVTGGGAGRLTPDATGLWRVRRGEAVVEVEVVDDLLNADTFQNFNYTPNQPLALDSRGRLWVTSPPSNAVHLVEIGPDRARPLELVPTGSWPTSIVAWPGTPYMLVSLTGRDALGLLDTEKRRLVDAIQVGDEPAGIAVDLRHPDGPFAYVALSGANKVARVNLKEGVVTDTLEVSRDPRALAFDAERGRLYVASLLSGNAQPHGPIDTTPLPREQQPDIAVIDTNTFERVDWVYEVGTLVRGLHLKPGAPNTLYAGVSHSRNAHVGVSANSRPHHHGLAVIDLDERGGAVTQLDLDQQPTSSGPAPSPHTLATSPDGRHLVMTLSAGNAILVLDADTLAETGRLVAGSDPRGLVFAEGRLWTSAWLDNTLQSWPLSALNRPETASAAMISVEVGDDPTPPEIKEGQRLFNNASFSGNGDFSCNNCHIDGLTDGLVWNILLDGDVNTLPFRNVGGTGPFLWGGILPTLFDFSREVLRLVGAEATGVDVERLTRYMQSVTAPPNPYTLPGGRFTPAALRGKALFEGEAECDICHSGPLLTNRTQVDGKTDGKTTDVPSLISVYDTGPWGREGQWSTLEEMIAYAAQFTGAGHLSEDQLSDLTAYVRQLPGDLLYLNSARPLDGTRQTFPGTAVELTFSSPLAAEQPAGAFEFVRIVNGVEEPLLGEFVVRGRTARFVPVEEALPLNSDFELRASAGLTGTFGQTSREPIVLRFSTGGVPTIEVTGTWRWDISGIVSGSLIISFIQSPGGQVSGVVLDGGGLVDFDHMEGFVTDANLLIEPFPVLSPVGQVQVDGIEAAMVDSDGDGSADTGTGRLVSSFGSLDVIMSLVESE